MANEASNVPDVLSKWPGIYQVHNVPVDLSDAVSDTAGTNYYKVLGIVDADTVLVDAEVVFLDAATDIGNRTLGIYYIPAGSDIDGAVALSTNSVDLKNITNEGAPQSLSLDASKFPLTEGSVLLVRCDGATTGLAGLVVKFRTRPPRK
ncbi:MAG: hypothetical protein D6722_10180 [Bacteroidetes bacterium]|nr:MAG: hypothetical protein D6722_10180 [Bacteroidota bacterium]